MTCEIVIYFKFVVFDAVECEFNYLIYVTLYDRRNFKLLTY